MSLGRWIVVFTLVSSLALPAATQTVAQAAAAQAAPAPAVAPTPAPAPAVAPTPAPAPAAAAMPTVDELIASNTQARGGLEKLKSVKSVRLTGKQVVQGMEVPFVLQLKRPNEARMEATVQGMTLVQAYDGKTGWAIIPFTGSKDPQKMPDEERQDIEEQADIDGPLVDYKAKGHSVELVGKEDLEGTPVYKLKLTLKNGSVRYLYLDAESFMELKMTVKRKRQGGEMELDHYMGDYKSVEGVMIPHSMETKMQGQTVANMVVQKVELNVAMDDTMFRMPEKSADKPAATGEKPPSAGGEPGAGEKTAPEAGNKPPGNQ